MIFMPTNVKKETRCIICGEPKNGLEVSEDWVIKTIRAFKKNVTKNEKNYRLVVCKECYPKYAKSRSGFNKRRAIYLTLGIAFGIMAVIASSFRPASFLIAIIVICVMYLLSLFSYMPALVMPVIDEKEAKPQHEKKQQV
jgi:hypothetical protein